MQTQATIPEKSNVDFALLLLRVASSPPFFYHGSSILLGWFGGLGAEQFAAAHHWPVVIAYLLALAEIAGAVGVATGILFRIGACLIVTVMLGAIFLVHLRHGYDVSNGGMEYALVHLLIASAFLLTGPGRFSLGFAMPRSLRKL